jgi:AcrR family transcriptional regulator
MPGERATKMLILSSARTLFSEQGYEQTPVEEICALAGIAKGTFFYHFESKQAIVRYIVAMQLEEYRQRLKDQMDTLDDPISKAEFFVSALIEQGHTANEANTYFKDMEPEWYCTVIKEERMLALLPLLEDVVTQGIEEGYFRLKNPSACAAIAFLGIDSYLHLRPMESEDTKRGIREMTAKTLGLKEALFAI